jgi:AraC-like DNA-binding protein
MDPLDDVFAAMRVQSALYARLETTAPWGIQFKAGQSARFGMVVRGGCWLSVDGVAEPVALTAGDCYVIVRGSTYMLRDTPRSATQNCFDVIGSSRVGNVIDVGGGGAPATVITGWFVFDELGARPLMELMPLLLHARIDQNRTQLLQSTLQQLAMETASPGLGSGVVVSRLADILFIEAIRSHVASPGGADVGWLSALSDRRLAPALRAMHQETAKDWTVEQLAAKAGMSRSAFAAHFKERVRQSPLEYLTRWRMFRAGALLRQGEQTVGQVAFAVGYETEAAFSKAFKRINGMTPGSYRSVNGKDGAERSPANPTTIAA